jgi:hypothetical protein
MLVQVNDRYIRAFLSKVDRNGAPDPAVSSGDQSYFPLQLTAAAIRRCFLLRFRPHFRFDPRLAFLVLWGPLFLFLLFGFFRHFSLS